MTAARRAANYSTPITVSKAELRRLAHAALGPGAQVQRARHLPLGGWELHVIVGGRVAVRAEDASRRAAFLQMRTSFLELAGTAA